MTQETSTTAAPGLSITVLIPAYNEEKNLAAAVAGARNALRGRTARQEIIILNACSGDRTGEIADEIAAGDPSVKVIHNREWAGLGANYLKGVRQAAMEYFVMFPGDNENSWESLAEAMNLAGQADIIIPYTINSEVRARHRRLISDAFVRLMNLLFNLQLRYYNGNAIYRTADLKNLEIKSRDFAYNAEILVKLLRSGRSFREIGIHIKPTGKTAIFNPRNIVGVIRTIATLFYDVNIKNRTKYRQNRRQQGENR
ncbi:MAG: glycosyltransferase family 2 protein [Desulfobulbaceae bacterium]|nr:glycosyltransferase family 2 protein [Desulfobulbaceae bacterium]